jgi:hypothetical protein
MPNMADITVKKNDGTTDIIYVSLAPSAGDKTPAQWRVEAIGSVPGNRPTFTVQSKYSTDRQARVVEGKLLYPETFTDSTTGIVATRLRESFSFTHIVRMDAADATTAELSAQAANLLKSVLMQSVLKSGFAPS